MWHKDADLLYELLHCCNACDFREYTFEIRMNSVRVRKCANESTRVEVETHHRAHASSCLTTVVLYSVEWILYWIYVY